MFYVGVYGNTAQIVDKHAEYHKEHIDRFSPGIEYEREDYRNKVAPFERLAEHSGLFMAFPGPVAVYKSRHKVAQGESRQEFKQEQKV